MHIPARETHPRTAFREELRRAIRGIEARHCGDGEQRLSLGIAAIDGCLGSQGQRAASLHEIAPADYRALPAAKGFLLAFARSAFKQGAWLWPLLPKEEQSFGYPYASSLRQWGIDPSSILFARCASARDALWTLEEGLKSKALLLALGSRPSAMDFTASRRLQLAAAETGTPLLLLRRHDDETPSAAVTRWRISPAPGSRDKHGLMRNPQWRIALEHARGGRGGEWVVEWDYETLCLCLSAGMGGRAVSQRPRLAAAGR